jgi:hypothetical protein
MYRSQVSALTAHGDTVKTLIGTLTAPGGVTNIVGIWGYALGGAGLTTLENVSGILELESDSVSLVPCQFPLDIVAVLTSGVAAISPRVWAVLIPVTQGVTQIKGYVTMDMAQTVAGTARFGLIYN